LPAEPPNLYLIFGFASQGYCEHDPDGKNGWPAVERILEQYCKENDERHKATGTGWILVTQGDGDYGQKSIESIAQYVRNRDPPTPVVFVQSDYGYAEPGTAYWPSYASAGIFGPGEFHDIPKLDKEGNIRKNKDGEILKSEAWGGYVKDKDSQRTPLLGFPDQAIMTHDFDGVCLRSHLGGLFVAGGGAITEDQVALYSMRNCGRAGDYFIPSVTKDGSESPLNALLAHGSEEEAKAAVKVQGPDGKLRVHLEPPFPPPPMIRDPEQALEDGGRE